MGTNDFNKVELVRWFLDNYRCWRCEQNHWNCFHHIMGRGNDSSKCESSILNAAPMNNHICHLPFHGELRTKENQKKLLAKTMRYLLKQGYEFNENDKDFIMKYKMFYDI